MSQRYLVGCRPGLGKHNQKSQRADHPIVQVTVGGWWHDRTDAASSEDPRTLKKFVSTPSCTVATIMTAYDNLLLRKWDEPTCLQGGRPEVEIKDEPTCLQGSWPKVKTDLPPEEPTRDGDRTASLPVHEGELAHTINLPGLIHWSTLRNDPNMNY
ncbi:hypothetical protein BHE74_00040676 [Ensete ventricosum]|nr:hypothetical protein BHE74_00040676 [Ensete ventricosum]